MNSAIAHQGARGGRRNRLDKRIRRGTAPIPDDHALAFVRDHAREFGLASAWRTIELAASSGTGGAPHSAGPDFAPSRIGLSHITYLAATRYGYDPLAAVVYHPSVHGICTLCELAQVTVEDLPIRARRERLYWVVPTTDNVLLVVAALTGMDAIAGEGEAVIAITRFDPLFLIFAQEHAEALFDASDVKPQRLWPVAHQGRLEFLGKKGEAGHTAATLGQTLGCLIEHLRG